MRPYTRELRRLLRNLDISAGTQFGLPTRWGDDQRLDGMER